ncbi:hypothetical protein TEA_016347 [Camellia sinensis var. sinensis]|uniref:Aconitase/3-isopropylmalate dehydratase large subunit alpha/beta/alpha domain-containing protein n=1 Tax=Camellia sinensis var. sinensis TaxID=542762 RepID=A0A4S4DCT0_CAMSN|nr:hypothetical protein TEA_016347 [Camellia sinensis var. sinensis]
MINHLLKAAAVAPTQINTPTQPQHAYSASIPQYNLSKVFHVNPDYKGVCHPILHLPKKVLLGTDSHTCTTGALGQFATGIGLTDAGFVLGTGKLLLKVPSTLRFVMDGEMPNYLLAKDLILQVSFTGS